MMKLRGRLIRAYQIEALSWAFIFLFVYAATTKLIDFQKFKVQIGQSALLTDLSELIAWGIPASELTTSILLAIPSLRILGLYASLSLMVMFTTYIFAILNFSTDIPCSCGGVLEKLGWTEHLIFNLLFTMLSITGLALHFSNQEENKTHAESKTSVDMPRTSEKNYAQ
jgi:uncharacterized membrane protein YphA (DoxX/SURF4 family)